ncbi:MAG TPA: hypothetical protein VK358_06340, partial [Longimicrobium sp.]|nr:hypothetical protein [Longimicrobium sp.]
MKLRILAAACALWGLFGPQASPAAAQQPGGTLRAFRSEEELTEFHRRLLREYQTRIERQNRRRPPSTEPPVVYAPPPPPAVMEMPSAPAPVPAAAPPPPGESVTNVQHAGVDEGGSGTGTVRGTAVSMNLSGCRPTAVLTAPDRMEGTFSCPVRL